MPKCSKEVVRSEKQKARMFCTLGNNAVRATEAIPKQPATGPGPVPVNVTGKTPSRSKGTRMAQLVLQMTKEKIVRS